MTINIKSSTTLKEIRSSFSNYFNGLKLEFFRFPEAGYEGPHKLLQIDLNHTVDQFNENLIDTSITLNPTDSVATFEEELSDILNVDVQVFRRSKELWIQTTTTDEWELERQNSKGLHSLESTFSS